MSVETDTGHITSEHRAGNIFHNIYDDEFGELYAFLTPKQARRIALDLTMAAERAEAHLVAAALVVEGGQS